MLTQAELKIKAVKEIPEQRFGAGRGPNPLYSNLIDDFLSSKDEIRLIEVPEKKLASLVSGLKKAATEHAAKVGIATRGKGQVYLSRSKTAYAPRARSSRAKTASK